MHTRRRLLAFAALCGIAGCFDDTPDEPATETDEPRSPATDDRVRDSSPADSEDEAEDEDEAEEVDPEEATDQLVDSINAFSTAVLAELASDRSTDNVFASPLSISLALAMVWAGSRGETETEMADVLQYPHGQQPTHPAFEALEQSFAAIPDSADAEEQLQLTIANAMWGEATFPFEDAYLETLEQHYGAPIREADLKNNPDRVRGAINDWVATETDENITELIPKDGLGDPDDDEYVTTVLANAVYFLADWKYTFEEEDTDDHPFRTLEGAETSVRMMHGEFSLPYAQVDGVQVVELPYVGERMRMTVVLPPEGTFESFRDGLTGDRLTELIDATTSRDGSLSLPRFEFSTRVELSAVLEAMGMQTVFTPGDRPNRNVRRNRRVIGSKSRRVSRSCLPRGVRHCRRSRY